MKVTQEISRDTLRHLIVAAWVCGWKSKADGYDLGHPSVHGEWDRLIAILDVGGDVKSAEAEIERRTPKPKPPRKTRGGGATEGR